MLADLTLLRGAAAYAALTDLERLATLVPLSPTLADRAALADAVAESYGGYRATLARFDHTADPAAAMSPGPAVLDEAERRLATTDWWEALAGACLRPALTGELFGALLDEPQPPADQPRDETGPGAPAAARWAAERLRTAAQDDPVLRARLAMWSRRLVGEYIVLAQRIAGERYPELAERLAVAHRGRLVALALAEPEN